MNLRKSIQIGLAMRQMRQRDLAKAVGISATSLSTSGTRNSCSLQVLERLAETLNMKVSEFVALGEDK